MKNMESFTTAVLDHFGKLTPSLDSELKAVSVTPYPEPAKFLLIEYDSPRFSDEFAVSLWAMDCHGQAQGDAYWFLKDKAVAVPAAIYEAKKYAKIQPWSVAANLLQSWFIQRWSAMASPSLPSYIGHHDSYFKKDLLTGERTDWDSILASVNG